MNDQQYLKDARGVTFCLEFASCHDSCHEATVSVSRRPMLINAAASACISLCAFVLLYLGTAFQVALGALAAVSFFLTWTQANTVYKESVRILPKVGVVITATTPSGFSTTRFLDWQNVGPVIMNEYVTTVAVVDYLTVLDMHSKQLLPVFSTLRPPLSILQRAYQYLMQLPCKRLHGTDDGYA